MHIRLHLRAEFRHQKGYCDLVLVILSLLCQLFEELTLVLDPDVRPAAHLVVFRAVGVLFLVLFQVADELVLVDSLCLVLYVFPNAFLPFEHGVTRLTRVGLTDFRVVDKVRLQLALRVDGGQLGAAFVFAEPVHWARRGDRDGQAAGV